MENAGLVDFTFEVPKEMLEVLESLAQRLDVTVEQLVLYAINQSLYIGEVTSNE
jgi:hypothetical protein